MASFGSSLGGGFSMLCGGTFDLGSYCIQRTIIDAINLLFLSIFCIFLLSGSIKRLHGRSWGSVVVSVTCALTSFAYFGAGLWGLVGRSDWFGNLNWLVYFTRGLVWISFTLALLVQGSKWVRIVISVWWVSFFLLFSALNVEILLRSHSVQVSDLAPWPLNLVLVFYSLRNFTRSVSEPILDKGISEPLLGKDAEKTRTELGQAGFFSKLTFSWVNPLLCLGYVKRLTLQDIPSLVSEDEADSSYRKFSQEWSSLLREKGSKVTKNLAFRAIAKVHLKENVFIGFCALMRTSCVVVSPLLLYAFVDYANRAEDDLSDGLFIVACLMFVKVVESLSQRHWFFLARRSGMRIRSALMVAVYQKQLKLSSSGKRSHSTGEIVNYIAVDAYRMGECAWWFHSAWTFAIQLVLAVGVLFSVVGLGSLPGLVPLFVCGFLNIPFARIIKNCQTQFMTSQDERLRSTSEVLNCMKIIKLQSWEEKFKNLIESRRAKEFKWLSEVQLKKAYGTIMYWMSPTIISSVVFVGCAYFHSAPLNAGTIFTILSTLRAMGEPVRMIPEALSAVIQVKVSFDRINTFLLADELRTDETKKVSVPGLSTVVKIQSGCFSWAPETKIYTLMDVNLNIKRGQKVAVCGPVGAGKSSLISSILGEIQTITGTVEVFGNVAYVSQTSWIQSGTVRDNILFGKAMDQARYDQSIKACALDKDFDSFDYGDLTEIGQRGLNLSGGQKQRIQLARAVYNDADIYLLDDPFSAVDAHTAATLFNDCVMGVLGKKTVVLVTHQVEFLSDVDNILVMDNGQITQSGSYEELLMAGTAFEQLVNAHKDVITGMVLSNNESKKEPHKIDLVRPEKPQSSETSVKGQLGVQLTKEEEMGFGDIGWRPFLDYIIISKGSVLLFISVLSYCIFLALQAAATYWLALAIQNPKISTGVLIGVYTGISLVSAVFAYLRSLFASLMGLKASKAFFTGFTNAIFRAPMLFFDSTPVGRILTRASSDLSILDYDIPFALIYVLCSSLEIVTTFIVMASVTWQVLIVGFLALVATKYVQDYYQVSASEITRINGTTKAPVMSYAAETSQGVMTIRAFNMTTTFLQNFLKLVDTDASLFFQSNASSEWLLVRIGALQNLTLFTAALLLVLLPKDNVAPGLVGLSLSYALVLTGTQIFVTRWYCNLANYIISVERIKQFMNIPPEPPAIVEDKRPASSWPSKGRIELQALKIKYRPNSPLVLKGITCTFKEGSRVGVVGRTGSGKTTLISALFRLVEPESGRILIDGLDICSIGLKDLRMKLSIIPQDPTLFKGSVRMNLDPLGLYSDEAIWEALEKCQLKNTISSLPNLLDSSVSDEGENWSAGQRQLFCLGRVLLKRNRILVLDEATASIDSATDAVLQRIIRQEFSECTVVTVAHRVPTVIDSDMVMVLSYGELLEYDEPSVLMDTNSSFSKLVAEYWSSCNRSSQQNFKI